MQPITLCLSFFLVSASLLKFKLAFYIFECRKLFKGLSIAPISEASESRFFLSLVLLVLFMLTPHVLVVCLCVHTCMWWTVTVFGKFLVRISG